MSSEPTATRQFQAFGYVRLSRLDTSTTSPDRQREIIADLCRTRGWELVETFEDLDVSGGKESRKGLDEMLGRLDEVQAIIVWKLDRLARSLSHLLKLADLFEGSGVQLVTSDGEVDTTTAGGRAFYQMRGVFAEFERRTVSERTRSLHAFLKANGRVQSRTPFGFQVNDERKLERDPDTWREVESIAERYAAGESLRRIATSLEVEHTVVRYYVRSPKVHAELAKDRPDLAAALKARLVDVHFSPRPRAILSGLLRCSVCLTVMRQNMRDGSRVYSCKEAGHVHINAEWVEREVVADTLSMLPWVMDKKTRNLASHEERADAERRLQVLEDEYDAGIVSESRYVQRRDRLLERLGKIPAEAPAPRLTRSDWNDLTPNERRLALREVIDYVEVRPIPKGQSRATFTSSRLIIHHTEAVGIEVV